MGVHSFVSDRVVLKKSYPVQISDEAYANPENHQT